MRIIWSRRAYITYRENLLYLQKKWNKKVISSFIDKVDEAVVLISANPNIGIIAEENSMYRKYLVVSQIYMYYRITENNELFIVTFWNNDQDPVNLREFLA